RSPEFAVCALWTATLRRIPEVEAGSKEREAELPDLHLDAVFKEGLVVDARAFAIGSVQRSEVRHTEACAPPTKYGVFARYGHVVEKDVHLRMSPRDGDVLVEQ